MSELEQLCKDVIKGELESSEKLDEISRKFGDEEIGKAFVKVIGGVRGRIEDPQREAKVIKLGIHLAEAFASNDLAEYMNEAAGEYQEEYGG